MLLRSAALCAAALLCASPVAAQDVTAPPPGVDLAIRYTPTARPALAVRPLASAAVVAGTASEVTRILERDLRFSDRFDMRPAPASLAAGPIAYAAWNSINIVWLVEGDVTATPTGFRVRLTVHDVPFGRVKETRTFELPPAADPGFRLSVHRAADEVVLWAAGEPGIAASRIAFVRHNADGRYDLMVVDSDGEDLRRLFGSTLDIYSPAWSPDGRFLVYTQREADGWHLVERDLARGSTRSLHRDANAVVTPQYSPDGTRIAFYSWQNGGAEILELERATGRIRQLTDSPGDNMYPSYSPDGRRIAFHSTRTGRQHVYVVTLDGGSAVMLSPFAEGVEYAAPDWSPTGTDIVFHGRTRRGLMQIMRADANRPGSRLQQVTAEGENEDPSWAPDGRHIVYSSTGPGGREHGLYVLDLVTGSTRILAGGRGLRLADWSGRLDPVGHEAPGTLSRQPGGKAK